MESPLTMGSWGILKGDSLLALIPMVMFIVLAFMPKKVPSVLNPILCCVAGCILCGVAPAEWGAEIGYCMNSTLGKIGFLGMLGAALGVQMQRCHVTTTLCTWIVNGIHVDSTKKGLVVIGICEFLCSLLMGSMSTAASAIAPILIPIAASSGISACALSTYVQTTGEAGMILSPTSGPVIALLAITGLSYADYVRWGALPFVLIFVISIFFAALFVNRKYGAEEMYDPEKYKVSREKPPVRDTVCTIAFLVSFVVLVGIAVVTEAGLDYIITVMFLLFVIISVFGGVGIMESGKNFLAGMQKGVAVFLLCVFYQFMSDLVTLGGGFDAVADLFSNVSAAGASSALLIGTLVGTFAITGGAAAQIQIIHGMFWPMLSSAGVPIQLWTMGLICGHRATNNIYPCGNMIVPMGLFGTENMKVQLIGCWLSAAAGIAASVIWCFVGPAIFM